jgi:hypothetical protein
MMRRRQFEMPRSSSSVRAKDAPRRKNRPPPHHAHPRVSARKNSSRNERQDKHRKEDGNLRFEQLVVNECAAVHRCRKQECNFSFRKNQSSPFVWKDPRADGENKKCHGANARNQIAGVAQPIITRAATSEQELEEVTVKVEQTKSRADEVLRLLETLEPRAGAVHEGARQEKYKRVKHGASFAWPQGVDALWVSAKISRRDDRRAFGGANENVFKARAVALLELASNLVKRAIDHFATAFEDEHMRTNFFNQM